MFMWSAKPTTRYQCQIIEATRAKIYH